MMQSKSGGIAVWLAILMNINVVTGGAFFLGAPTIAQLAGPWAPLAWLAAGLLLTPLVLTLAELSRFFPRAGGIYVYSTQLLGSQWGFFAGWGYFLGAAAGNAAILHGFALQSGIANILPLGDISLHLKLFIVDLLLIALFAGMNYVNVELLKMVQVLLTALKCVPVLLLLLAVFAQGSLTHLFTAASTPLQFTKVLPIVLFSYIGIESCCAICHTIENGKINTGRILVTSLILIACLYSLLQLGLQLTLGLPLPANPFSVVVYLLPIPTIMQSGLVFLINIAILASFLGGYYGMFYSNNWNLYAMAQGKSIIGKQALTNLNRFGAPWGAIVAQSLIIVGIFLISSDLVSLMTMSDFGTTIAYSLSALALIAAAQVSRGYALVIGFGALLSCAIFSWYCVAHLAQDGWWHIVPFLALIGCGFAAHWWAQRRHSF